MSFTAASFRLGDFIKFAEYYSDTPGDATDSRDKADEILGQGIQKSNRRIITELTKRYNSLTPAQRRVMVEGNFDQKREICYLAIAKSYQFIREFIVEIVREKRILFDLQLSDTDFAIFLNRKNPLHPELEQFTDNTIYKVKQTLFKILADASIIDSTESKKIKSQWPSNDTIRVIVEDNPEWLKIFLLNDLEITEKRKSYDL